MTETRESVPIFRPISADDPEPEATEIESFCMNCEKTGITKLLLTKIPFYKEVIIMSFDCPHCGFKNNEIQSGAKIEEKGIRFTLTVSTIEDLNRQVFKSDYTSIKIPELDFEIPMKSQKGEITTVEGIIERCITGLNQDQSIRREMNPDDALKIDNFIKKVEELKLLKNAFTLILEDISGNSFISNPNAPLKDEKMTVNSFLRSKEQNEVLGIFPSAQQDESGILLPSTKDNFTYEDLTGEVVQFDTTCNSCGSSCETNMKLTDIPYFKNVIIMATNCERCGYRTNEVKSGGGIEPKGIRIQLKASTVEDYSRDILKSETCLIEIPEMELEVGCTALSGRFTTLEGILEAIHQQLSDRNSMFMDSNDAEQMNRMSAFLEKLKETTKKMLPVTIILDDPAGNSYVQSLTYPDPDPALEITQYERSSQQNDDLGLNDIKTENYENNVD